MNILQICFAYPPSFSGYGRQLSTLNCSLNFPERDLKIRVITAFDGNREVSDTFIISALLSRRRTDYRSDVLSFYAFCVTLPFRIIRHLRSTTVVHVVKAGPEAMIAIMLSKIFRKPVLVKIAQEEYDNTVKAGALRRLRRRIVAQADILIAISARIRHDLLRAGVAADRIVEIPNAVDTERFAPVGAAKADTLFREALGRERQANEAVFLFLGAINKRKGVHDLLDAIELMQPERPACFLFAGPDKEEIPGFVERLATLSAKHGTFELRYLGFSPTPERLLQFADALVLPSYSEGMPNVVLESMACGVPVIASDIPVHRQIISSTTGRLFELGNAYDLSRYISNWQNLDREEMRRSCREHVVTQYSLSTIATRYAELYERLAKI